MKPVILLFSNLKPRRPPGGFPKLYFSLKFWLSFKKCWKNDNIAHLKIGAYTLFDGRYVTKPKIFSKQDRGIIFFSSESWDVPFSKSETQEASRRPPEALFWFENFVFFWKFWKISKFHIKIELREASWMPPGYQIWKTQHLSFHWKKKLSHYLFLNGI